MSGRLRQKAVGVEHELGGDALVEVGVALRRILEADGFGIDDLRDRQAVSQQRHHELTIVAQDGRLAGVEGVRLRPAKAQAKTEATGLGGFVVRAGILCDIQSRYADGAGRPDDLHRLVQHDGGLIATAMALGFKAHRIDDRIHRGLADDRGHLVAEAVVLGEIYGDKPTFLAWLSRASFMSPIMITAAPRSWAEAAAASPTGPAPAT